MEDIPFCPEFNIMLKYYLLCEIKQNALKSTRELFSLLFISLFVLGSCSKDPVADIPIENVYAIKSIYGYGKTHGKFIYNSIGKIAEYQSFSFYNRFIYDNTGRLVKQETAADPDLYSSQSHERSELMTSENSSYTGYSVYEYDRDGKLNCIKNYFKNNNVFKYTSMNSFEYDGNKIVKRNLHNSENSITQIFTYEYDNNNNVIREKHYSLLFNESTVPELISETTCKYDTQNNPFQIYKELGDPGLYTNTNNIIETNSVFSLGDEIGLGNYSSVRTNFTYNKNGFPVMVVAENSVYEYLY